MSGLRTRIQRLEERHRRDRPAHVTGTMCVPPDVPQDAWDRWVAGQPCACGVVGCPERRVGLLLPTKCQTADAWSDTYAPS
jgi:hypothetical protein